MEPAQAGRATKRQRAATRALKPDFMMTSKKLEEISKWLMGTVYVLFVTGL
jgi:hypothetical protein